MYSVLYSALQYHTEYFHRYKKNPLYLFISLLSLKAWQALFVYHLYSFAFSRMPYKWNHTYWLLSFNNMHLRFLRYFSCLLTHVFLSLNSIQFYGFNTVCSSVNQLKGILVACRFWQLLVNVL